MRKLLYVSPSGTEWKVHWEGEQQGDLFDRKEDAIRNAGKMVGKLPEGQVSSIRIQKTDGTFQTEWSYGRDPYPPRG
jgi:hypothetical protein